VSIVTDWALGIDTHPARWATRWAVLPSLKVPGLEQGLTLVTRGRTLGAARVSLSQTYSRPGGLPPGYAPGPRGRAPKFSPRTALQSDRGRVLYISTQLDVISDALLEAAMTGAIRVMPLARSRFSTRIGHDPPQLVRRGRSGCRRSALRRSSCLRHLADRFGVEPQRLSDLARRPGDGWLHSGSGPVRAQPLLPSSAVWTPPPSSSSSRARTATSFLVSCLDFACSSSPPIYLRK